MIVNMFAEATKAQIDHVVDRIKECGFQAHLIHGEERTVIGIVGNSNKHRPELEALRPFPTTNAAARARPATRPSPSRFSKDSRSSTSRNATVCPTISSQSRRRSRKG